jgi:hypothetical protein
VAKVIQIATGHDAGAHTLYALDAHGQVWYLNGRNEWIAVPKLPGAEAPNSVQAPPAFGRKFSDVMKAETDD